MAQGGKTTEKTAGKTTQRAPTPTGAIRSDSDSLSVSLTPPFEGLARDRRPRDA